MKRLANPPLDPSVACSLLSQRVVLTNILPISTKLDFFHSSLISPIAHFRSSTHLQQLI